MSRRRAKRSEFLTRIKLRFAVSGALPRNSVFVQVSAAIDGVCPMKNAFASRSLPHEHYVIRIDGRVKSHHRRFLDALIEGLQLRNQFPQHDVKVESLQTSGQQRTALH